MEREPAEAFVERVRDRLVGALYLYCGDLAVAEDLAQEALARAWERWDTIDQPEPWTSRVAFNLARSRWRRRSIERRANQRLTTRETGDRVGSGEEVAGERARAVEVRAAVSSLSERQRQAVVLRYFLDLPVREIASVMDCAEGTVKATLHQATAALGKRLTDFAEVFDG